MLRTIVRMFVDLLLNWKHGMRFYEMVVESAKRDPNLVLTSYPYQSLQ